MPTPTVLSTAAVPIGGALTTVTLQNKAATGQTNVPFTFGQVFALGQFPSSTPAVELRAAGVTTIPCQLNVKAKHPDGSIKHAIISGIVPTMPASTSTVYDIARAASAPVGAAPVPSDFAGLNAVFTISDNGINIAGPTSGTTYTADASVKLNAGAYVTWMSGPIVSEWIVRVPFLTAGGVEHPDLHARFSIRAYKGQAKAKIDCVIENTWVKPKVPQPTVGSPWEAGISVKPVIYSYSLSIGGSVADTRAVKGYHRARLTYNSGGTYPNNATGIPNDATIYTATITIDGVAKAISVAGSSIQTYSQLYAALNTQMGGLATCVQDYDALGLRVISNTTGANSSAVISGGTLFPALKNTQPYRPIRGNEFIHYANARWKKTFWWGGEPALHIAHDKNYLIDSMAVPNYIKSLTGSATTIANDKANMAANGDIGQNGITKGVMSAQGYANGIGILPEWQAMYIVNQGIDAKATMLKQADLGGSWSAYYRDYSTDEPINFSKWPYATVSPNAGDSRNSATGLNEMLPQRVPADTPQIEGNGYDADVAHHPDFYYVPYLVTGDHFYMEGMISYFIYTCLKQNAHQTYRDGAKVLFKAESQIRGQGWLFRSLAHNRYLLPDNHAHRPSLEFIASSNAASYNARYVDPAGPEYSMFGIFGGMEYTVGGQPYTGSSGFMEFHAISGIGRSVELGFDEFLPLLGYKSKLIKGLLTSGPDFCWQWATAYTLRWRDTSTSPQYTSWKQVYDNTLPYIGGIPANILSIQCGTPEMGVACGEGQNAMVGYPLDVGGYPSNMTPAAAYCASYDMPSGDDAWLVLDSRTKKPDYNTGPQFATEPRTFIASSTPAPTQPANTMPVDTYSGLANQTLYFGRSV